MALTALLHGVMQARGFDWWLLVTIVTIEADYSPAVPTGGWFGSDRRSSNN